MKKMTMFAFLIAFCGAMAYSHEPTNVSSGLTLKKYGLAMHGYDAVAYFTENRAVRGTAAHATVYQKAVYRFTSEKNLKRFEANPAKYAPQFGGYCAYGVSVGAKFDGDPDYWRIVSGKLYFNLNGDIQKTWLKDVNGNVAKAEENWTRIARKSPQDL